MISSTTKIRKAGFNAIVDTEEMMFDQLGQYEARAILPRMTH